MDAPAPSKQTSAESQPAFDWLPAILIAAALTFAITRQSFWIDETTIGVAARQPSLRAVFQQFAAAKENDIQAPLYTVYFWLYARVFGTSEWALRAANLFWLVPGLILFVQGFRRRLDRWCLALAIVANACLWYYVGEARLYSMLMGTSCLVFAAIHQLSRDDLDAAQQSRWLSVLLAGFILVCGTTMLGAVWSCGSFLLLLFFVPKKRLLELWRGGKASDPLAPPSGERVRERGSSSPTGPASSYAQLRILATFCILLALGAYYYWTLRLGARATAFAKTDWRSMGFIIYEHLGFSGLGPGRTDLRSGGVSELRPYAGKLLIYAALAGVVALRGVLEIVRRLSPRRQTSDPLAPHNGERVRERGSSHPTEPVSKLAPFRRLAGLVLAFALPTFLLLAVGMASHWRVLGRHCIVLMPGWITLMGLGVSGLWRQGRCCWKAVGIAFLIVGLWSCVAIRFAVRHERDDYRDAAQVARAELSRGRVVWWNAVGDGAAYYQVPLATNAPEPGKALLLVNITPAALTSLEKPDLVIVSKPELFDLENGVSAYLTAHHYKPIERYPSFTLWRP